MAISKIIYKTSPQDTGTVWMDATPATASASDITAPKTAMLADGVLTTGTGSGGGGGLEYEEGTWTPVSDTNSEFIFFANAHTTAPIFVMMADTTGTYDSTTYSNYLFLFGNFYGAFGQPIYASTTSLQYAAGARRYRGSNATSISNSTITQTSSSDQYVKNTGFDPTASAGEYYRTGRTYKWIAVWAPPA